MACVLCALGSGVMFVIFTFLEFYYSNPRFGIQKHFELCISSYIQKIILPWCEYDEVLPYHSCCWPILSCRYHRWHQTEPIRAPDRQTTCSYQINLNSGFQSTSRTQNLPFSKVISPPESGVHSMSFQFQLHDIRIIPDFAMENCQVVCIHLEAVSYIVS